MESKIELKKVKKVHKLWKLTRKKKYLSINATISGARQHRETKIDHEELVLEEIKLVLSKVSRSDEELK